MEKFIPVVVIKELSETDKILTAQKSNDIHCAEITFCTACAASAITGVVLPIDGGFAAYSEV